jgi:hypothetical protein
MLGVSEKIWEWVRVTKQQEKRAKAQKWVEKKERRKNICVDEWSWTGVVDETESNVLKEHEEVKVENSSSFFHFTRFTHSFNERYCEVNRIHVSFDIFSSRFANVVLIVMSINSQFGCSLYIVYNRRFSMMISTNSICLAWDALARLSL